MYACMYPCGRHLLQGTGLHSCGGWLSSLCKDVFIWCRNLRSPGQVVMKGGSQACLKPQAQDETPQGPPELHFCSCCLWPWLWKCSEDSELLHQGPKHTKLAQEVENLKKDPGDCGAIVGPAAASQQWAKSANEQQVCEWQSGCSFPSALLFS